MRYFPIFVDLKDRRVVVIGGGEEALRKIRLLLKTQAQIEIIAPSLHPELAANPRLHWVSDVFIGDMLDGAALVFSSVPELNEHVSKEASARGIPCNAVDEAHISSFIVPSIVDRDPVVIAIGTEGTAPVLGQNLRAKIDALLPASLGLVARKAASLRDLVASKLAPGERRRSFWNDFFFGKVAEAQSSHDPVAYELALGDSLFQHATIVKGRISIIAIPSEADLLTIKAQRRLMEADIIVSTSQTPAALLEMARRDAVRSFNDKESINAASQGKNVVLLAGNIDAHYLETAKSLGLTIEILGDVSTIENQPHAELQAAQ